MANVIERGSDASTQSPAGAFRGHRLQCNFGIMESLLSILIWMVLSIVTLGLALLFFPYFLNRSVLNQTEIVDTNGKAIGRLDCNFSVFSSIIHAILWGILIFITFGLAAFFYVYRVVKVVLNETRIVYY